MFSSSKSSSSKSSLKQSFRSLTPDTFTWPIFSNFLFFFLNKDKISSQIVRGTRLFEKNAIVLIFFSSVFPNDDDDDDDDDDLGERKANATFAADDEDDSSNNNRLLARSFSHTFSSSSFSLVRSNTSSSIGFVNNIII